MSKRSVTVAAVDVEALEREAQGAITAASTRAALDDARIRYLGRKSELKQALRGVRDRDSGMTLNAARERLEAAFEAREADIERVELDRTLTEDVVDVTLPGTELRRGHLHLPDGLYTSVVSCPSGRTPHWCRPPPTAWCCLAAA